MFYVTTLFIWVAAIFNVGNGISVKNLIAAIETRSYLLLEQLLPQFPIDVRYTFQWTVLHYAAILDGNMVRFLLDRGARDIVNATNTDSRTPLLTALGSSLLHEDDVYDVVDTLIGAGSDLTFADKRGSTALHYAEHETVARLLISREAPVNKEDHRGRKPVYVAVENNNLEVTRVLIEDGDAELHNIDSEGNTLLHVHGIRSPELVKFLTKYADINAWNAAGETPITNMLAKFFRFRRNSDEDETIMNSLEMFFAAGADVNGTDAYGNTVLHVAACNRHLKLIKFLIEKGADAKAMNSVKDKPIHVFINYFGHKYPNFETIFDALMEVGGDINEVGGRGNTPLHLFVNVKAYGAVKNCIKKGADPNIKNLAGETPLLYLMKQKWRDHDFGFKCNEIIFEELIEGGADVNIFDEKLLTPLYYAKAQEHNLPESVIQILKKRGAKMHINL